MSFNPKYEIVYSAYLRVELKIGCVSILVRPTIHGERVPFLRKVGTRELLMVVMPYKFVGLQIKNESPQVVAIPIRLGGANGRWANVWTDCDETRPSKMPANDGMWELRQFEIFEVKRFAEAKGRGMAFVPIDRPDRAAFGTFYHLYNRIEVYYRPPEPAGTTIGEDRKIFRPADDPTPRPTEGTGVEYGPAVLLAQIRLVTPLQAYDMLRGNYPTMDMPDFADPAAWETIREQFAIPVGIAQADPRPCGDDVENAPAPSDDLLA